MPKVFTTAALAVCALLLGPQLAAQALRSGLFPLMEPVRRLSSPDGRTDFNAKRARAPTPRLVQKCRMNAYAHGRLRPKTIKPLFSGPNPPDDYLFQEQDKIYTPSTFWYRRCGLPSRTRNCRRNCCSTLPPAPASRGS